MVRTTYKPCNEANEEQEFYYMALCTSLVEIDPREDGLEEFFCDESFRVKKNDHYPTLWRTSFYDPFRGRV